MDSLHVLLAQLSPVPQDVGAGPGIAPGPDDEPVRRLREAAVVHATAVVVGPAEKVEGAPRPDVTAVSLETLRPHPRARAGGQP